MYIESNILMNPLWNFTVYEKDTLTVTLDQKESRTNEDPFDL